MAFTPVINPQPLGVVTVAAPGTPVRLTAGLLAQGIITAATDHVYVNKVNINTSPVAQAGAGNTGAIYLGIATMNKATLAGVLQVLTPGMSWGATNNVGMNTYDISTWYIDADNGGDGIYGSVDQV